MIISLIPDMWFVLELLYTYTTTPAWYIQHYYLGLGQRFDWSTSTVMWHRSPPVILWLIGTWMALKGTITEMICWQPVACCFATYLRSQHPVLPFFFSGWFFRLSPFAIVSLFHFKFSSLIPLLKISRDYYVAPCKSPFLPWLSWQLRTRTCQV